MSDRRPFRTSWFFAGLFLCGALLALSPSWGQDISANQIDELITKLRDSNPNVRQRAAIELGRIGASDERVVPALIKALEDKDGAARGQAAAGLGRIGAADERVVPALIKALDNKDGNVRQLAADGLRKIGVSDERDVPAPTRP